MLSLRGGIKRCRSSDTRAGTGLVRRHGLLVSSLGQELKDALKDWQLVPTEKLKQWRMWAQQNNTEHLIRSISIYLADEAITMGANQCIYCFCFRGKASRSCTCSCHKTMNLILPLKRCYFEQIRDGVKPEEYRLMTPFWRKRLEGKTFEQIILTLGYPKADDEERRLIKPWRGYVVKQITHPHFGPEPVNVFAIRVAP
jgi:hypothetical protein